ncbi:alkaline phosphatase D family protein [Yeosuana sp. MJ-SS3]|uniref:Alkaline phosphatase D family protein n=1 Tax=Gilvirhabdus luticola TaxID=3079858 RepID=A0ABU3U6B6_9FLAO|nr:alkaline phosphatase D family protein [Yeosuana sp. MJ-SS3]MDU8885946.1 alkaline phosphatase D family protein [Yeosuana sp. MJ-SS3]
MKIKLSLLLYIILFLLTVSCKQKEKPFKIAFGSCASQDQPLPIFNTIVAHNPDIFVFLGDNIYGDTKDMDTLRLKYNQLAEKSSYQNLKENAEIIATWDDHDFGWNDSGKYYEFKEESKEIFLDFFEEPKNSIRRTHQGIYHSYEYKHQGKIIQVILLDVRTFRDNLKTNEGEFEEDSRYFYELEYAPHPVSENPTLLGSEQWKWLRSQLEKPADVRIIGSGTQFGIEFNGYEAWANFPNEQERLLDLIIKTKANGVLFISGDVHYAEISKLKTPNLYPIYDITSSGLSSTWYFAAPNKNRIEGPIMENHFGLLTIDFDNSVPNVKAEIWDIEDNQRIEYTIPLNELNFDK